MEIVRKTDFILHYVEFCALGLALIIHLAVVLGQVLHRSQEDGMFYALKVIDVKFITTRVYYSIFKWVFCSKICVRRVGVEFIRRVVCT